MLKLHVALKAACNDSENACLLVRPNDVQKSLIPLLRMNLVGRSSSTGIIQEQPLRFMEQRPRHLIRQNPALIPGIR